jgi:hypothetical protein
MRLGKIERPITSIFLARGAHGPPRVRQSSKILVAAGFEGLEHKAKSAPPRSRGTARLHRPASVEHVNDQCRRGLDRALFLKLARVFRAV